MARTTSTRKKKATATPKEQPRVLLCTGCDEEKKSSEFYKSYNPSHKTGILPYCKECMVKMVTDDSGMVDKDLLIEMLHKVDRPFVYNIYEATMGQADTARGFVGYFMKNISLMQYRELGFKDSVFLNEEVEVEEETATKKQRVLSKKDRYKLTLSERSDLIDKWGNFSDEHLFRFEKTYQQMAKGYQIHTTLHQEALVTYSKYKVLQDLAIESGNLQEAKIYGDLATKARTDAKLNPSQLTKNDMQVGGVDSFSQIADLVARRDGLINIPMQYLKRPQDILDWQMLENVNYMRSSLNMPEIEYEEMHKLYFDRIEKFNERYDADIMKNDFGTWND